MEPSDIFKGLMDKIDGMTAYLKHIEQTCLALSLQGQMLQLYSDMLSKRLLEHNICSEEELRKAFEEEVNKPLKQHLEKAQASVKEQMDKATEEIKKPQGKILLPEDFTEEDSNLVLASERFKKE